MENLFERRRCDSFAQVSVSLKFLERKKCVQHTEFLIFKIVQISVILSTWIAGECSVWLCPGFCSLLIPFPDWLLDSTIKLW